MVARKTHRRRIQENGGRPMVAPTNTGLSRRGDSRIARKKSRLVREGRPLPYGWWMFRRGGYQASLRDAIRKRMRWHAKRDGRSLRDLMRQHFFMRRFLPHRLRRQRLAAARSRHGSDTTLWCHSLPCRHFVTSRREPFRYPSHTDSFI